MIGLKFGRFTVLSPAGKDKNRNLLWSCRCECGVLKIMAGSVLRKGDSESCGCLRRELAQLRRFRDLSKEPRWGRLTVISHIGFDAKRNALWRCICDCGTEKVISGYSLTSGHTTSCGCFHAEQMSRRSFRDLSKEPRWGRLTVLFLAGWSKRGSAMWECVCECGSAVVVLGTSLTQGRTTSCGCYRKEATSARCKGENHHNWRGGTTALGIQIRSCQAYVDWRPFVFRRDRYTCQGCETKSGPFVVDHVYPFSWILADHSITSLEQSLNCADLWDTWNGRTLCDGCHRETTTFGSRAWNRQ